MTDTGRGAVPALELRRLSAGYGTTTVVHEVDVTIAPGAVVALLGPNGAGKTTLLRAIAGQLDTVSGELRLGGAELQRRPFERARQGLCLVPEGRGIFPNLTVKENLILQLPPWKRSRSLDPALEAFPALAERLGDAAGNLSGGQQQMLALSRAFLAEPTVVLLDEVSMGLAPRIIDEIFVALRALAARGASLLLVEQYVGRALAAADHVYILGRGHITFSGGPAELEGSTVMDYYAGTQ
jgi:branched-chain amino acid transport system ATP-binding protein